MKPAENTAERAQRIADRRQKPNPTHRKPGSRRWAKAARRVARNKRRAADIRHTTVHKASRVAANNSTHAVLENLSLQNMAKPAKGTKENPGTNVRQKSGLNKAILYQCWGMLARLLEYKLAGHVLWVAAAYASQTCSMCGFVDKKNRNGRVFLCLSCRYIAHADRNAARNIEAAGIRNIGKPARPGKLALRTKHAISDFPATPAGNAHVKGRLDVEGSCVSSPMNRQAPTGMWPSGRSHSGMTCNPAAGKPPILAGGTRMRFLCIGVAKNLPELRMLHINPRPKVLACGQMILSRHIRRHPHIMRIV